MKKALGLTTENKPRSKSYIFSKSPEESFEFATRKDAMDGMNVSSTKLANGIKDGKILIGNIESEQNDKFSFTQKYQKHKPSGFCFKIVCFDERYNQKPVLFRARSEDEDVSAIFVEMLERDIKRIQEKFDFSKKMIFSLKDKDDFEKARVCWICQKEFGEREKKVRDHCHFTGKYRGAAHVKCNLQFKKPKFTPVIFHNLSGYDAHLFVKNLGRTEGNIKCIPNNEEKYISFSKDIVVGEYVNKKGEKVEVKHEIRFLDSFKFMASSLESPWEILVWKN